MRQRVSTGTAWENVVGYSRAVRVNRHISVAGTAATDDNGNVVGIDDAYQQTRYILKKIQHALQELGGSLNDVVRTRMFVTDIDQWEAIGRAHGEFFADIRPAATMVEVSKLVDPQHLVEIEADAILSE